jgi:hypothetical protein
MEEEEEIPKIFEVKKSEPAPIEFNDATPNTRLNYLHIGTLEHYAANGKFDEASV